ncbi:MAG TPA: hypothetical protein VG605_22625, partial [Puia sp.]|nr:hypothetical protein [Puia sp.]
MKKLSLYLFCSALIIAGRAQGPQVTIKAIKGLPFLSLRDGRSYQSVELSLENGGDSTEVTVHIKGAPDLRVGVGGGSRPIEVFAPEVKKATDVGYRLESGGK